MPLRWLLAACLAGSAGIARSQPLLDSVPALVAAAAAGGSYQLAAGTYLVTEPWVVARDFELRGAGREATHLRLAAAPVGLRVEGGAEVRLAALALVHAADAGGDLVQVHDARLALHEVDLAFARSAPSPDGAKPFGYGSGLALTGAAHVVLTSSALAGHELSAIEAYDESVVELRDVALRRNATGVFATDRARVSIDGGSFTGHDGQALHARGSARVRVTASSFVDDGGVDVENGLQFDAVRIGEGAVATFDRSVFREHVRFALSLYGDAQVTTTGNLFEANGGRIEALDLTFSAVLIEGAGRWQSRGDTFRANPGGAFELIEEARAAVHEALLDANGSWSPVYVVGGAQLLLTASRFLGHDGAIYLSGASRSTLRDNLIADNGETGVWLFGDATAELRGNTIRGHDVGVRLGHLARAWLVGNVVEGNGAGVAIFDGSDALLEENVLRSNGRDVARSASR